MKKIIIILGSLIVAAIIAFFCCYFILTAPKYTGNFSVRQYNQEMWNVSFQTDKHYGSIVDVKAAAKVGKVAIAERFEDSEGSIFEWMACEVRYDQQNDSYYVRTYHVSPRAKGGAYDVILHSDGTVLAIWGEK